MTTYRYKQPPTVQAWQWDGTNIGTGEDMEMPSIKSIVAEYVDEFPGEQSYLKLHARVGGLPLDDDHDCVDIGDWVVQEPGKPVRSFTDTEFRELFEEMPE